MLIFTGKEEEHPELSYANSTSKKIMTIFETRQRFNNVKHRLIIWASNYTTRYLPKSN